MNPYYNWINYYSNIYGVDPELAKRIAIKESNFNPRAVSPSGAIGIMQLMPGTAKGLGIDPYNPEENIKGGIKYYADMKKKYGPIMGLAAYNWGPGNVNQYLSGKKKMPEETENYLAALGQYADPSYAHSPMDLQGRSGVMPEMLPVSNPTPQVTPQVSPQVETPKMDDYEQMKIFNPYVQLALGILAGNTGQNKTEAFANAMRGGLTGLNAAQRSMAYEQQTRAQTMAQQRADQEYAKLQQRSKYMQDYAANKLQDPNLDPNEKILWEMAHQGDMESGIKLMSSRDSAANKAFSQMMQMENLKVKQQQLENKNVGSTLIGVDLPKEHPLSGLKRDQKGNLFDSNDILLKGSRLNWATEMASRPKEEFVPQKTWESKNDPLRIIPPQEFSNWQNDFGDTLQESDFPENVSKNGYKYVPNDMREKRVVSKQHLGELELQMDRLFNKETGVYPNMKLSNTDSAGVRMFESGKNVLRNTGYFTDPVSQNLQKVMDWKKAFLSALTKERGETGVLTQQDVERVTSLLVSLTPESLSRPFADSSQLAWDKMKEVYHIFASRGVKNRTLEQLFNTAKPSPAGVTPGGREYYRE